LNNHLILHCSQHHVCFELYLACKRSLGFRTCRPAIYVANRTTQTLFQLITDVANFTRSWSPSLRCSDLSYTRTRFINRAGVLSMFPVAHLTTLQVGMKTRGKTSDHHADETCDQATENIIRTNKSSIWVLFSEIF